MAGLAILGLQFFLFVFGLPPFQMGIWFQTEPTLVALYVLAVANVIWLGVGYLKRYLSLERPHALWICLIAWVVWQWIVTLYASSAWRSWFGAAEIGLGAAWHTALLLCSLLCAVFWQNPRYRRIILFAAVTAVFIQCTMHWINAGEPEEMMPWRPARWPDYLAFIGAYMWIAAMAAGYGKKADMVCLLILFTYTVLYFASNMTGTVLVALAMLATTLMPYPGFKRFRKWLKPSQHWRRFAMLACFLPFLWIAFSAGAPYLPLNNQDSMASTFSDNDDSMGARVLLNRIALSALAHEPARGIFGAGWSNFTNDSYSHALVDDVRAYENGIRKSNALHVNGSAFHSHSEPLEVLLALGLPGLMLWFAFPLIIIRRLPNELFWQTIPMLVAVVCLYYFWFVLPQVMAYQAIAIAALAAATQPASEARKLQNRRMYLAILEIVFLAMAFTAYGQFQAMRYSEKIHYTPRDESADIQNVEWLTQDLARGGDRLRVGGENFFLWAWDVDYGSEEGEYHPAWHNNFLEAAQIMADDPSVGPRSQMLLLWMQQKLLLDYSGPTHDYLRTTATRGIKSSVMLLAKAAPMREDLAAIFLMNLSDYTKGNISEQVQILTDILKIYPGHRSALWLLGHIYLTEPKYKEEGEEMIRRAVAAGVDRVYPIANAELIPWQK